jgi:hypothetical protein
MKKCIDIYNQNKGESCFGASIYIDPLGFEYNKSIVACHDCMFNFGHDSCVLFKDAGDDESEIRQKVKNVSINKECQYFLIQNFSEGDDEDEKAREAVKKISARLNYPQEYWRRHNIHKDMEDKGIGHMIAENQSCSTCEFCENAQSTIGYCKFHKIELFVDERHCENYLGVHSAAKDHSDKILITAALYANGDSYYQLNANYSLKAKKDHTFSIVKTDNLYELLSIEPYLLSSIQFSEDDGHIHAHYIDRTDLIDPERMEIVKTLSDDDDDDEDEGNTWLNSVSEDSWFEEIDKVKMAQSKCGVSSGDRMKNCERCHNVTRNNEYPDGSPTGLVCSLKDIFVTANGSCTDYYR